MKLGQPGINVMSVIYLTNNLTFLSTIIKLRTSAKFQDIYTLHFSLIAFQTTSNKFTIHEEHILSKNSITINTRNMPT